ncbi:MAG: heparinase II/III family protein, partial [Armatimonadota bacterium]
MKLMASVLSVVICAGGLCAPVVIVIDEGAATARDERQTHAAWVGFRPAQGQIVHVNPPRFSWPYNPGTVVPADHKAEHSFTLQVSRRADMSELAVDVAATPYNFYNALPVLEGSYHWFWRVGYDVGTERERWSGLRTFAIAQDAVEWDRTIISDLAPRLQSHPRIVFTPENIAELRSLKDRDAESARIYEACLSAADAAMKKSWFTDMPKSDPLGGEYDCTAFRDIARDLHIVALAYVLSGDRKYLACKGPLLTLASYPPGGASSPEGLGESRKWATMVTPYMGLCFDWLYPVLTAAERDQIAASLEFRIEHIWKSFSWYRRGVPNVRGLAMFVASHPAQDFYWTLTGALALYERSQVAREFVEGGLHYLVGVTNGFGPEEAWNEGLSYGNGKCATLLDATLYALMTIPDLHLERNPCYGRIGSFFSYLSPVGMERSAWGNYGGTARTHLSTHQRNHRRFAFLTGDGTFLENWRACREVQGRTLFEWQEYGLPRYFHLPQAAPEGEHALLCNLAGWAMAFSGPPSDPATYTDGVGITFHCRPRGGYSHSFQSENAFELFAYGSVIATGGGRKTNGDRHAAATMSHNSVLIDGHGQRFTQMEPDPPTAGRIIAWRTQPGLVYWCGDATAAYARTVPYLQRFLRHVLFVDDQFFVIFDDLETAADNDPARFSWLYHVHQDVPVALDARQASFSYQVREANVTVRHLLGAEDLALLNQRGEDGYKNPITGEDMLAAARKSVESSPLRKWSGNPVMNNIWVTTETPAREGQFLAVVLPWREGAEQPRVTAMGERGLDIEAAGKRRTIAFGSPA